MTWTEVQLAVKDIEVSTGGWGTMDLEGASDGYTIFTRLTFRWRGGVFTIRGRPAEIRDLMNRIGEMEMKV